MRGKLKRYALVIGGIFTLAIFTAGFYTLYIVFMIAYINPYKTLYISINMFHEADLELILLTIGACLIPIFVGYQFYQWSETL